MNMFAIAMDMNAPPGITHPMLVEKYDWVDVRLRELYYGYALTADNYDEFVAAGLFLEKYDWIDRKLEENEKRGKCLMLAPVTWVNYRKNATGCLLEEEIEENYESGIKRKRSESDIADYADIVERAVKRVKRFEIDTNYYDEEYDMDTLSELTEEDDSEESEIEIVVQGDDEDLLLPIFRNADYYKLPEDIMCWNNYDDNEENCSGYVLK